MLLCVSGVDPFLLLSGILSYRYTTVYTFISWENLGCFQFLMIYIRVKALV